MSLFLILSIFRRQVVFIKPALIIYVIQLLAYAKLSLIANFIENRT